MDFIEQLLKSENKDIILVIVERSLFPYGIPLQLKE